jgi:predicted nuclease with TOPRIM domain
MREQLEKRLAELRAEFETGQKKLEELEAQASNLRAMLLRISGAIQVLEEELGRAEGSEAQPQDNPT